MNRPERNCISTCQMRIIVRGIAEQLALNLVGKGLLANQLTLTLGYDIETEFLAK